MTGDGTTADGDNDAFITADDVSLAGTAEFAVTRYERDVEALTAAQLDSYAFTVDGAQLVIGTTIDLTLSGAVGVAQVTPDGDSDARYTAVKMKDITVTADASTDTFGLTGTLTLNSIDHNGAADTFDRLDWTTLELNPGADLPTPQDLTIDFTGDFVHRVTGSVTGDGTTADGDNDAFITADDVSLAGTAEFAVTRYERDVEALTAAQLDSYAFTVDGAQLVIGTTIDLTLSGAVGVAQVTPDGDSDARYTAVKMKDITVTADASTDTFGLTGTLTLNSIDHNGAADTFDRLDWTTLELNPGADLPTPQDLTIDFTGDFVHRVTGSVTGDGTTADGDNDAFITADDVSLAGTAEFAVTRYERDVEALTAAQLDSYAFTVDGAQLVIGTTIDLTLSGAVGVAQVTPDGDSDARYTAVKMKDITVTADASTDTFGLTGTLTLNSIDHNGAADTFDRLDWTTLELNPGADLPTPQDLTIDFTGDFVHRVTGSVTGDGTTADGDNDAFITADDVSLAGTAEFAVTRYERDVEALTAAQLDSYAFTVDGAQLVIGTTIDLTLSELWVWHRSLQMVIAMPVTPP